VYARSGEHGKPVGNGSTEKYITWKEGKRNALDAVFPVVSRRVEGEEGFKSLPRQVSLDYLFVLMASVKSVPGRGRARIRDRYPGFIHA
jgi:hypothetical protein